jgi:antitoxin component HigA of HigAB toxin-antitoxin module
MPPTTLPTRFENLVELMPLQSITTEAQLEIAIEVVDRLMAVETLTPDQERYLESLVHLVQAYESVHHAIDTANNSPPQRGAGM